MFQLRDDTQVKQSTRCTCTPRGLCIDQPNGWGVGCEFTNLGPNSSLVRSCSLVACCLAISYFLYVVSKDRDDASGVFETWCVEENCMLLFCFCVFFKDTIGFWVVTLGMLCKCHLVSKTRKLESCKKSLEPHGKHPITVTCNLRPPNHHLKKSSSAL